MELILIEAGAYLELKRQLSTLSVQMADFQKKIAPQTGKSDWTHKMCAWLLEYPKEACRTTGKRDLCLIRISAASSFTRRLTFRKYWKTDWLKTADNRYG